MSDSDMEHMQRATSTNPGLSHQQPGGDPSSQNDQSTNTTAPNTATGASPLPVSGLNVSVEGGGSKVTPASLVHSPTFADPHTGVNTAQSQSSTTTSSASSSSSSSSMSTTMTDSDPFTLPPPPGSSSSSTISSSVEHKDVPSTSTSSSLDTIPLSDTQLALLRGVPAPTISLYEGKFTRPVVYGGSKQGAKSFQEDSFFSWSSPSGRVTIGAVFDGHGGYNGQLASLAARDHAVSYYDANRFGCEDWSLRDWEVRLKLLFTNMHKAIREKLLVAGIGGAPGSKYQDEKGIVRFPGGFPVHGGTTASMVIQIVNLDGSVTLLGANVGDSTAVCVNHTDGAFTYLTEDHGPENPVEYRRVCDLPASDYPEKLLFVYDKTDTPRKYECPLVFKPDGSKDEQLASQPWHHGLHPTNARYEPAVYAVTPRTVTRDSTCIAMTRALGDFYAHQFGLTFEPSLKHVELPPGSSFSVYVASDGVWDCWRYEDWARACVSVVRKAKAHQGTNAIGASLLAVSMQRAIASFGEKSFDDATLVCWLHPSDPTKSTSTTPK